LDRGDASHDVDAARVEEIRQGLADGTLTFDTGRIADGILASARAGWRRIA
jgi:negative regulator of flagellin synthesis FlgM